MSAEASHRWDLSEEEARLAEEARRGRITVGDVVRAHLRNPRLVRHTLRSMKNGAVEGAKGDPALVWSLHADRIRRAVPGAATGIDWHGHEEFVAALRPLLNGDARVLEIGVGSGRVARLIAGEVGELVGTDASQMALVEARGTLAGFPNVRLEPATGYTLAGFADASFDVVYSHDVFLVFEINPALALIDEARRVLKPGGAFVASFYTIDRPAWAAEQVEMVRRAAAQDRFTGTQPKAYAASQVDSLCEAAGLEVADRVYGEPREPGEGRRHYIVTARRPADG